MKGAVRTVTRVCSRAADFGGVQKPSTLARPSHMEVTSSPPPPANPPPPQPLPQPPQPQGKQVLLLKFKPRGSRGGRKNSRQAKAAQQSNGTAAGASEGHGPAGAATAHGNGLPQAYYLAGQRDPPPAAAANPKRRKRKRRQRSRKHSSQPAAEQSDGSVEDDVENERSPDSDPGEAGGGTVSPACCTSGSATVMEPCPKPGQAQSQLSSGELPLASPPPPPQQPQPADPGTFKVPLPRPGKQRAVAGPTAITQHARAHCMVLQPGADD